MSYETFIPTIWNETINRELERLCVFAEDCNRQYEGDVKQKGDSVKILGAAKPTIHRLVRKTKGDDEYKNTTADIADPEELDGTEDIMYIRQVAYFNYMIGDIDKAQAINGVMESLSQETSEGLANEIDTYISALAVDNKVTKLHDEAVKVVDTKGQAGYVLSILDQAIQKLYENDVNPTTEIVVTVSPRFYTLFRSAYIDRDTNNSSMMKNGKVGMYGNVTVKMSNNVHKTDDGATDNIMIRTKRAIAFVNPLTHTEPYRPEKKFADAVKGFTLFDAKVVRPKEIININVKYA